MTKATYTVSYYIEAGFTVSVEAKSPAHAEKLVRAMLDDEMGELVGSNRVHYDDGICEATRQKGGAA